MTNQSNPGQLCQIQINLGLPNQHGLSKWAQFGPILTKLGKNGHWVAQSSLKLKA